MKIACLDWGQAISNEKFDPYVLGWRIDGPHLPIEYCRIEDSGEVIPVMCINAMPKKVAWSLLKIDDIDSACKVLRDCHKISPTRFNGIGSMIVSLGDNGSIGEWCIEKEVDAVVWIALPPRCDHIEGKLATLEQILAHLENTTKEARKLTRKIMKCSSNSITTAYSQAITQKLDEIDGSLDCATAIF